MFRARMSQDLCGMFNGIAVFLIMYLVVMPRCAFHSMGSCTLSGCFRALLRICF